MSETKHSAHCCARRRWGDGECECEARMLEAKAAIELDGAEVSLRRAWACVSACAGIPTEALEAGALEHALSVLRAAISFLEPDQGQVCIASLRALGRLP